MKKNILTTAATAVVLLASVSAYADTATDTQDIRITVPETVLIDMIESEVAFVCALATADTAGSNFVCNSNGTASAPVPANYDITANVGNSVAGAATSRSLTVGTTSYIDPSWNLRVAVDAPNGTATSAGAVQILTNASPAATVVSGIKNVAVSNVPISYTLAPTDAAVAMAFSDAAGDVITLTYTLGDDS